MSYPKNFPGGAQIQVALIAGGDITDPAKDHSCNQRLFSPLEHSDTGVNIRHLAFSPMLHSPTNGSQQSFHGTMDPGSLVYVLKTTGQNGGVILGQANDILNWDRRSKGNDDLLGQTAKELFDRTIKINIPPDIQETTEKGAKVKKIKEKNREHSHSVLKGLPSHGALHQMSGWKIPQLNSVPTAIQDFAGIPTNDMLSNMPGQLMSIGGMFRGLAGGFMGGNTGANGKNPSWVAAGKADGYANSQDFQNNFGIGGSEQPNEEIIRMMYLAILGREPEEGGLAYWLKQAQGGMTAGQIFSAIMSSDERNANVGSTNDNAGVGSTEQDIENFLSSPDFEEEYGIGVIDIGTKEYVTKLYQKLLGREPDEVGLNYWSEIGWDAASLYRAFLDSTEYKLKAASDQSGVTGDFQTIYGQAPDENASEDTIRKLYQVILHREPEEEGLKFWTERGKEGMSGADFLSRLSQSDEFKSYDYQRGFGGGVKFDYIVATLDQSADETVITEMYNKILKRDPDAEGLDYWIKRNLAFRDILPFFVSSDEYQSNPQNDEESIGSLIDTEKEPMKKTPLDKIRDSLIENEKLPHLADAITSLALLTQGSEGGGKYGGYVNGYMVNSDIYLANAYELLNNVKSLDDIMRILHRLQYDQSLFGLEDLQPYETMVDSAFGPIKQTINYNGEIKKEYAKENSSTKQQNFSNLMNDSQKSSGAGGGSNMFGGQVQQVMGMFQRLPPNAQKAAMETVQKNSSSPESQKLMQVIRTAVDGGNPLSAIQSLMV